MRPLVVTSYAVGRLRERLKVHGRRALVAKSDSSLKGLLDEAVTLGVEQGLTKTFESKKDGKGLMVDITETMGCDLWAFVRPDRTREGKETGDQAVITVMDHELVSRLEPLGGLGKVSMEDVKDIIRSPPEETEPRLISYLNIGSKPCTAECLTRDVKHVIQQLVYEGAQAGSCRVWKPVKAKARVVVDLED